MGSRIGLSDAQRDRNLSGEPLAHGRAAQAVLSIRRPLCRGAGRGLNDVRRPQLEEIIRAASELTGRREFILFGSQTVHAITSRPPAEVLVSRECDVWISDEPALQELLKRELGADSPFRHAKGFYVDPLPPDLPLVPPRWEERLLDVMVDDLKRR